MSESLHAQIFESGIYHVTINKGENSTLVVPLVTKGLNDKEAAQLAKDYPAYWKVLPAHWAAIDTYRIDDLFPLPSSRLYHTRKKLLVPGCRTGGKTVYQDLKEAHRTLGAWLAEQPEHNA
jgi:hypothetical protein